MPLAASIAPLDHARRRVERQVGDSRDRRPGYTFDAAYKIKIDGKEAYEVRGKDKRGKVREVEVSATGEVIAIE